MILDNSLLISKHTLDKENIQILKIFNFYILTNLYVLRSPELIYSTFTEMYVSCISVCVCVCMRVCVCVCVCGGVGGGWVHGCVGGGQLSWTRPTPGSRLGHGA